MGWFQPPRLRIGVTGHRLNQLPEAAHPAVRRALETGLLEAALAAKAAGHGFRSLTLVSALAEGADRIAAHAALGMGWRMISPIPFKKHRYEQDFETNESVREFRSLWRAAEQRWEIDGEALQRGGYGDASPYAAVGREITAKSDLLIAVWNGAPPKGPGGTAEVCARMLAKGGPVLWINAEGEGPRLILPEGPAPRATSFKGRLWAALKDRFPETPRPEAMRIADG